MGAGQIGGIATLLDMDFKNAATFLGEPAESTEAQHVVHFLSHAMMFCLGVLIEAHVVLTPANCVHGERYKFNVVGGTHKFLENAGTIRVVDHLCIHRGYNSSLRWTDCLTDNLGLLVLNHQFSFHTHEDGAEYIINRVRYGISAPKDESVYTDTSCKFFGFGSRRNSEKFGALCPDDVGSVIVCSGFVRGMMISRLVDRPCGVGFLDLTKYSKFLTCGVDDSRDVIAADDDGLVEFANQHLPAPLMHTLPPENSTSDETVTEPPAPTLPKEDIIEELSANLTEPVKASDVKPAEEPT